MQRVVVLNPSIDLGAASQSVVVLAQTSSPRCMPQRAHGPLSPQQLAMITSRRLVSCCNPATIPGSCICRRWQQGTGQDAQHGRRSSILSWDSMTMIAKGNIESMHVRPISEWGEGCGVGVRAGCRRIGGASDAKLHRIRKVQGRCWREARYVDSG
jgi:hypothetical protein